MNDNQKMQDAGQVLIIAAISIMTIILTIIGIQLIMILRDVRRVMTRAQGVLAAMDKFGVQVSSGTSELLGFFSGLKNVLTVIDVISQKHSKNGTKK